MLLDASPETPVINTSLTATVALLFVSIASSACAKRSHSPVASASNATSLEASSPDPAQSTIRRINVNTASAKELETLPGIGQGYAERIVEYREKYGPFRRAEHLMMVRGISDKRFRALRDLITIE
jgi:competence ComEA-like helix-hairpin-helix protein